MKHQSDTYYSKEANTSQHKYPGQVWTKRWWVTCKENLQFVRWSIWFASCSLHFLKWLNPQLYVKEKLVLLIFHRTFHLEHNSIIKHCTHNKASFYLPRHQTSDAHAFAIIPPQNSHGNKRKLCYCTGNYLHFKTGASPKVYKILWEK